MKIPGRRLVQKAQSAGNEVEVPLAHRLGLVDLLKFTFKEVSDDHLMAFAGSITYSSLLAIFPFFTFLLSLLGLFNATNLVGNLLNGVSGVLPGTATTFIKTQLLTITQSHAQSAFTVGAIISVLVALYGTSGAFRAVMEAMNVMYEVEEDRPFWKVYGISILISLVVVALLLVALGLVVLGGPAAESVASAIGLGAVFKTVWAVVQWPILACLVLFAFALIYYYAPAVEQRWRWISLGSIFAFVFWLVFSLLFSFYVSNFGSYNATYGSLAGVVILLLYIYYSSVIVLIGAEMNQVIEEHIPGGKNEGEKTPNDSEA